MRIDLHSHSNHSDGTDSPPELIQNAEAAGLSVLALTDHDTFSGWDPALSAASRSPVLLVPGVEISCRWKGASVHLLAYDPDPAYGPLVEELARIRAGRMGRIPAMVESLVAYGVDLTVEEVLSTVVSTGDADSSPGRPHVADALVRKGYARSRTEAFDRWLVAGRPGYVNRYAPLPSTAVALVVAAGGVPVLAHPRGRGYGMSDEAIAALVPAGLAGLEVDHRDHSPRTRAELRALADSLGLAVTGSSDYHGAGKVDHDLGCETTAWEQFEKLFAGRALLEGLDGLDGLEGRRKDRA